MINSLFKFLTIVIFITACSKVENISIPDYDKNETMVKIESPVRGHFNNSFGIEKKFYISNNETHFLQKWPKTDYNTVCIRKKSFICLIDTKNNNSFSHSALRGRKELYPLDKPINYKLLYRQSNYIEAPKIYHNKNIKEKLEVLHIPLLNTTSTKEVGESMYKKLNSYHFNTYSIKLHNKPKGYVNDRYGNFLENIDFNIKNKYPLMKWSENNYNTICQEDICLIDTDTKIKRLFTHVAIKDQNKLFKLEKGINYSINQDTKYDEDSFKYEVIYQGKISNSIKILFREYTNNLIRSAFTQEIEYELNKHEPTIIGFKGLRIKVFKATNLNITYQVIQDFN